MRRVKLVNDLCQLSRTCAAAWVIVIAGLCLRAGAQPPDSTRPGVKPAGADKQPAASGQVLQIKSEIAGDLTYRFITDKDQTFAPTPLPAASSAGSAVPVTIPASIPVKSAILEVVDKKRGNVAHILVGASTSITLTEASFKYIQTVFINVLHDSKPVTDVLVTLSDASHKFSQAWPLKKTDAGTAQFANVPMGEPITVGINGAGHAVVSQTNTLIPDHAPDGYHWPPISVDWADAATVAAPTPPVITPSQPVAGRGASESGPVDRQKPEERGGGFLSSAINTLLGIAVIVAVIYGAIWAFNKGHVKALLDKAGINTADLPTGAGPQPSPFDKPAKAPLTPITEGTADPFAGGVNAPGAPPTVAAGPRLIATAGTYSGSIFPLSGAYAEIGRDPGNVVPLPNDTNASRKHASINIAGTQYTLTDNGSSNGTFLNGVRISANTPQNLRSGDEVQVGMTRFRFEA